MSRAEIRAVLVDFDEVIFDYDASLRLFALQQYQRVVSCQAGRIDMSAEAWCDAFQALHKCQLSGMDVYRRLGRRFNLSLIGQEELLQDWENGFRLVSKAAPESLPFLRGLHEEGLGLVLLSGSTVSLLRSRARALHIEQWLAGLVVRDEPGQRKHDPQALRKGLACAGNDDSEVVILRKVDVSGIRLFCVRTLDDADGRPLSEAVFASTSLADVADFILGHAKQSVDSENEKSRSHDKRMSGAPAHS